MKTNRDHHPSQPASAFTPIELLVVMALVLIGTPLASAQNRVLELDGNGDYVVLPPNIFTNLTEATVEVWAKWDSFLMNSRVFDVGAPRQSMILFSSLTKPDLRFDLNPQDASGNPSAQNIIGVNDLLRTNEWIHLAAITGPGGMKLYANGVLVGEHASVASFADIKVSQTNYLGRGLHQGTQPTNIFTARWMKSVFGTTGAPKHRFARTCSSS